MVFSVSHQKAPWFQNTRKVGSRGGVDRQLTREWTHSNTFWGLLGSRDQTIYALMLELSAQDERFDLSTIVQILEDRGQLERAGGAAYIASLLDGVIPDPALVKRHVESIQRKAQLRRLQMVGEKLVHRASESGVDPSRILLDLSNSLKQLQLGRDLNGDLLPYVPADLSRRPEILRLSQVEARDVDWLWRPYLANHMLAMLSGDPGAGKTYIAMAICAAVTLGHEPSTGVPSNPSDVLCLSVENAPEYVCFVRVSTSWVATLLAFIFCGDLLLVKANTRSAVL